MDNVQKHSNRTILYVYDFCVIKNFVLNTAVAINTYAVDPV
jgi:hypothetical protein